MSSLTTEEGHGDTKGEDYVRIRETKGLSCTFGVYEASPNVKSGAVTDAKAEDADAMQEDGLLRLTVDDMLPLDAVSIVEDVEEEPITEKKEGL